MQLVEFVAKNIDSNLTDWAWGNYKAIVRKLALEFRSRSMLEVGAGRDPLFDQREIASLDVEYTANDISETELARGPSWARRACFDIAGDVGRQGSGYDLIFSQMVLEHVSDGEQAYRNVLSLLSPGGIAIHFHPTLFAPPFVLNRMLPEAVSGTLLRWMNRRRHIGDIPKFPARYELCRSTQRNRERIARLGFGEVVIAPFYGHRYFEKLPLLRDIDRVLTGAARSRDFRNLSSFAFTLVRR